jgi:hypothetical protein
LRSARLCLALLSLAFAVIVWWVLGFAALAAVPAVLLPGSVASRPATPAGTAGAARSTGTAEAR